MTEPLSKSWCRMIKHRKEKVKMIQFRNDEHKAAYDDLMQAPSSPLFITIRPFVFIQTN